MLCVCTRRVCVRLPYWSAKQCDWLSHARPAQFPFPLFIFPGANTATQKHSFKTSAINGRANGSKKKRTADMQMENEKIDEHLKLGTMHHTILYHKNCKKFNYKTH